MRTAIIHPARGASSPEQVPATITSGRKGRSDTEMPRSCPWPATPLAAGCQRGDASQWLLPLTRPSSKPQRPVCAAWLATSGLQPAPARDPNQSGTSSGCSPDRCRSPHQCSTIHTAHARASTPRQRYTGYVCLPASALGGGVALGVHAALHDRLALRPHRGCTAWLPPLAAPMAPRPRAVGAALPLPRRRVHHRRRAGQAVAAGAHARILSSRLQRAAGPDRVHCAQALHRLVEHDVDNLVGRRRR